MNRLRTTLKQSHEREWQNHTRRASEHNCGVIRAINQV